MKVLNYKTNRLNSTPDVSKLEYGEIAVNYAKGGETLFIKNNDNEIAEFKDKKYIDGVKDNIEGSLTTTNERIDTIENYVEFLQGSSNTSHINLYDINHKIFCNISKNSSLTFNNTSMGNLEVGKESHIIINNTGSTSIVVTIPNAAPYYSNVDEISIDAGMYGEVNVIKGYNNKIYIRAI